VRRERRSLWQWTTVVSTAALALALAVAPASAAPSPADGSGGAGSPWTSSAYTPHPGDWQPYVLAPSGHTVRPVSVLSTDPRGGSIQGDPKAALGGKSAVTLTSTGTRTTSPLLTLDFGKEVGGEVSLHVLKTSTPAPQLHACFSESTAQMALTPTQNNGEATYAPGCDTANIWNGYPGTAYTWDSDSHTLPLAGRKLPATVTDSQPRGGFRYLTLFLDGPGSVTLDDVSLDFQAAPKQADPAAYQGWFLSSSNDLNKLWYAGAYTVQMDTWMSDTAKSWPYDTGEADHADAQVPGADPNQEVILDGAKRDRVVWQGDLSVEAPVTYLSTDDVGAVDNSLTSLAGQQLPDGFVPAESLVGPHNTGEETTYGEYVTWFVDNAYDHWLYTGDRGYLAADWSGLGKAVAWLESVRQQDPQGLIAFGAVNACGHYGYSDCGHETYVNALYVRNLHQMAQLASVLGDSTDAATYTSRATTVSNAVNAQLWDPTVGAYRLSRETPDAYPQDANATAVLTGVASPAQSASALAYLRANNWSDHGSLTVSPSTPNASISPNYEPLPSGFEAEDRLDDDSALSQLQGEALLNAYWGYQLGQDPGSTYWEATTTAGQPALGQFTSLAHGWAAAPTIALTNDTLGVTPTSGGYATFDVVPHPGDLTWAQGVVPTPHGSISTSWQATSGGFTLHTTVPRSGRARLAVPTSGARSVVRLDGRVVWDGRHAVGGAHASSDGGYVYVDGVGQGSHTLQAQHVSPVPTRLSLDTTATPTSVFTGGTVTVQADLGAVAQGRVDVTVSAKTPTGWHVTPPSEHVRLSTPGVAASGSAQLRIAVPEDAKPGTYQVTVTASGGGAHATNTVPITVTPPGYDFDTGVQGWQAGPNSAGVAEVTSIANRPGSCHSGGCLQVSGDEVAATDVRSASVTPTTPVDMSGAGALSLRFNSWGGVPDATGYQATITLTGTDGTTLTRTYPVSSDTWTPLSLPLTGWSGASSVNRIEVGFAAVGTTYSPWNGDFQLDDLTWN
jgi:Bacterial alpha-L-rhamnosidase 6 hairpin glycosidase domain/Bacterial alpha-L-rhamnosidase C-terminal domain